MRTLSVLCVVFAVVVAVACGGGGVVVEPAAHTPTEVPNRDRYFAEELLAGAMENPVRFDQTYKGRFVMVVGQVVAVKEVRRKGAALIGPSTRTTRMNVRCEFDAPADVTPLTVGRVASVIGRCEGVVDGVVFLEGCRVKSAE